MANPRQTSPISITNVPLGSYDMIKVTTNDSSGSIYLYVTGTDFSVKNGETVSVDVSPC